MQLARVRRTQAGAALRRPAPAGGARAGAGEPAEGAAARRAARRAGPEAPPGHADRAEGDPAVGRVDVHLRDARPGRGAHHERPPGGVQPRAGRAGGDARRGLRASGDGVRRGVRRRVERAGWRGGAQGSRATRRRSRSGRRRSRCASRAPAVGPDECSASGHVREVVYLGAVTRYIVQLDVGGELVVMQQNLTTSSMEALQVRGKAVLLVWERKNNRPVEEAGGALEGSMDQEEGAR